MSPTGRSRGAVRLRRSLLRRRAGAFALVAAMSFLLGCVVVSVSVAGGSMERAVQDSVRSSVGQQPFSVQAGTETARSAIGEVPELIAVRDSDGFLASDATRSPGSVRALSDSRLALATVVAGRAPRKPAEASVSAALAEESGTSIGDSATVVREGQEDVQVTVVGVTANPSDAADRTIVFVDPSVEESKATLWLSAIDPYSVPTLRPLLDVRAITYRSTASAVEEAARSLPVSSSTLRTTQWGLAALFGLLLGAVLLTLAPLASREVEALNAAGMASRLAWRCVAQVALGSVMLGYVAAVTASVAGIALARVPLSGFFGQRWLSVTLPVWSSVAVVVVTLAAAILVRPLVLAARALGARLTALGGRAPLGSRVSAALVVIGVVVLAVALVASRQQEPPDFVVLLPLPGALAVVVGLPDIVARASRRRASPAIGAVTSRMQSGLRVAVWVAAVIAVSSGAQAATATRDANAFEAVSGNVQPRGSLLVTEVPAGAAELILARYKDLGGRGYRQFNLPDERRTQLRVTGPALVGCMESAGTTDPDRVSPNCFPQDTYTPVAPVALGLPGDSVSRADPGLVSNGEVGLLEFPTGALAARTLASTSAESDPILGGNMPGFVVPEDGPVAARFGLEPSGTRLIGLLDFASLSGEERARMRSVVAQVAPAAQVVEASDVGAYDQERGRADAIAIIGAVLAGLVLLGGGAALVVGQRRTRRTLVDIGISPRGRTELALRLVAVPVATMTVGALLARLTAAATATSLRGDVGWHWLLPTVSCLVCCTVLYVAMLRAPERGSQ